MSARGSAVTIKRLPIGKTELRLVQKNDRFYGLIDGKIVVEGEDDAEVWRDLCGDRIATGNRYIGMDGARRLFLHHYPNGFGSQAFAVHGERGYKIAAKQKLDDSVSVERALTERGLADAVLAVFNATDLLSIYEKMRIRDALHSKDADSFIQAAARFTLNDNRTRALRDMERALIDHEAAKWTCITYLPFLWRPSAEMYLKPHATLDFAERTTHRLATAYSPELDIRVYEMLLDLARKTMDQLGDLGARDNIDVQSFIWVVSGSYEGEAPRP